MDSWEQQGSILDAVSVGVVVCGRRAEILFCNQIGRSLLGRTGDLPPDSPLECLTEGWICEAGSKLSVAQLVQQAIATGATLQAVVGIPQAGQNGAFGGSVTWLRLSIQPLPPSTSASGAVCTLIDLTEQRPAAQQGRFPQGLRCESQRDQVADLVLARQELMRRTEQLEAINRELESFSYSVSHDLRAPLRHISGFVAALGDRLAANGWLDDPKVTHYLDTIRNSSRKMGLLIDGLLDLSRVTRRSLVQRPVSLRPLVDRAIALATSDEQPGFPVEFVIGDLPTVSGDATLLQQVFANLIDNAVKFSRPTPQPRVEIGCLPNHTLFVRDNGVGFPPEFTDQIFGAFQRLHPEQEFEGMGIGLALVQRIILRHGGKIWAESQPGQGSTLYFTLQEVQISGDSESESGLERGR
ncbi:ATP-binding protein [Leptolyngbya sp. O-77]|uniref:PAS domain-containing sensor histidine kinase n=1 Tax=Leptolyngbya sp. O-77 TaxID=1080068 RepID=UPI0018D46CEA|nr:ATP-binding protein [Leptolyngbya sp. O-77]